MSSRPRIAFLGAGNMAGALISGLLRAGVCTPDRLFATDVRPDRLRELEDAHGLRTGEDNGEAATWAEVVVLCTKPQVLDRVLDEVAGTVGQAHLVISIAAGVPISAIEARLGPGRRVVRAMPNTPALVGAGATAVAAGTHATEEDLALARTLFDSVGITVVLDESQLDAVTGLSGSGPAYVFLAIEALSDAGVRVGLPRDVALRLSAQTVLGSARLLVETGGDPERLREMVTSPGGTTVAGLAALEAGGLRKAFVEAVEAATRRSTELGEETRRKLGGG